MLASIFKYTIFGAVMLLVGQIPIGGGTLGGKFTAGVGQACQWTGHEVQNNKYLAGVGDFSSVERWWKSATPSAAVRKHAPARKEIVEQAPEKTVESRDADGVSQADREALIRLLQ